MAGTDVNLVNHQLVDLKKNKNQTKRVTTTRRMDGWIEFYMPLVCVRTQCSDLYSCVMWLYSSHCSTDKSLEPVHNSVRADDD